MKRGSFAVLLAASALAVVVSSATAAPSSDYSNARAYISHHGHDARVLQANVLVAQIDIGAAVKNPSQANLDRLALDAQDAHDNLNNIRNNFAESDSGAIGNAELNVFAGANDLKNSMGALVAYAGNPNAATAAHFVSQFRRGRTEWNSGIRTIWRMAHKSRPPTI